MKTKKFKDIEKFDNINLSFINSLDSMKVWLSSLSSFDFSAKKILNLLQSIDKSEIRSNLKYDLLIYLSKELPTLIKHLEINCFKKLEPFTNEFNESNELLVWNNIQLAHNLWNLFLQNNFFTKEEKGLLLYSSLDALNNAILYISISYSQPISYLWKLAYSIYDAAGEHNLLYSTINNNSISNKFKKLIVFHLCNPYQFHVLEQSLIFKYLDNFANQLIITDDPAYTSNQNLYVFNLKKDIQPVKNLKSLDDKYNRYANPAPIAKSIYENLRYQYQNTPEYAPGSINRGIFLKCVNSLGLAQKRKSSRINKITPSKGIVGLNKIINYYRSNEFIIEDNNFSSVDKGDNFLFDSFVLENSNHNGYGILSDIIINAKVGNVIAFPTCDISIFEIGAIRRISTIYEKKLYLGIEILNCQAKYVLVKKLNIMFADINGIFLPGNDDLKASDVLLHNSCLLNNGDYIYINHNSLSENLKEYKIYKTLQITQDYTLSQIASTH